MHPHSGDSSRWAGGGASGELSRGFCADLLAEYHFNEIAVSRERWERLLSLSTNKSLPAGPAWQAGEHPTQAAFQAGKLFPGRCMAPATGSTQGCWKHGTERVGSRPVQLPRTGWGIWGLSSLLRCIRRCAARFPRRVGCWGGGMRRHTWRESSRNCYCRITSQSKHEDPGQCPLPAASDLWAARHGGPGFAENSRLQTPSRAMIYGRLGLKQAETVCLIARRAWPHLTTLLGRGWGEGLPPGRLEGMNQSFRNALRETHGEWGGAQGVRHMVLQEGWGSGRACPAPLLPQGLAGFWGAHQARPYPALPEALPGD